jgi:hypothetical protein
MQSLIVFSRIQMLQLVITLSLEMHFLSFDASY